MKTLHTLLFAFLAIATAYGQTRAKGNVKSDIPYEVYILDYPKDGPERWIRWELWEMYQNYHVTVQPFDRIQAVWVDPCTGDTLARAYFNGAIGRHKYTRQIVLDGSTYEIGKWPFAKELAKNEGE